MHVGILGGTGPLGAGLGLRLADSGATVTIGSRDATRGETVVAGLLEVWPDRALPLRGGSNEAAAGGDIVVMATPWEAALATVAPLADALSGTVVVSVANALVRQGREMHALFPARGSVGAAVASALPRSLVASAGHHLPAETLGRLDEPVAADVLVCSDRPEAAEAAAALFERIPGVRALQAGSLASSSAVEAFTAVLVTLNMRYTAHCTLRLAGLDHVP